MLSWLLDEAKDNELSTENLTRHILLLNFAGIQFFRTWEACVGCFNSLHFLFLSSIPISFFLAFFALDFGPSVPTLHAERPILCCHRAPSHDGPRITDI